MVSFRDASRLIPTVHTKAPYPAVSSSGRARLSLLVNLLLVLAIGARIMVAVMGPEPAGDNPEQVVSTPANAPVPADLAALQALGLFAGNAGNPRVVARQMPADSSLNLVLQGVMLGGQPQASVAVIVSNARQASYHPGEALPGAGNIVLDSIAADHVIVDNNGRKEALWLDASPASNRTGTGRSAPTPPPGAVPLEITGVLGGRTAEGLPVVAATLSEIIKVQPAQENGQLIGYRLSPGEKLREFVQLGLETNDVVTQVNGLALNDMANMPKLYALMNEATEVSFLLLREGKPMTLQFALTDAR
jgi:general secretion pathway protein C